ncbi:unnamed protein product [Victoria cruziana]
MELRRSQMVMVVLFVLLCFSGSLALGEVRRPKNVQVSLRAKWSGTPLLLEAGELLSKEWKDIFWEFIDVWHEAKHEPDVSTARSCLQKILSYGRSLLKEPLSSVFEFSLVLRTASPRLVLYRQLAKESISSLPLADEINSLNGNPETLRPSERLNGRRTDNFFVGKNPGNIRGKCCWAETGSTIFFDVSELLLWLDSPADLHGSTFEQPQLFDFDHVYPESSVGSQIVILYGALGTLCFKDFHVALVEAAKKGKARYVVRPVLPSGCEQETGHCGAVGASGFVNLGGYGVELALKNMEYKAMDDSTMKKGVTLEDPRTEDLNQEVRGFIFSKILERRPELSNEVMSFRDYLLSSSVSDSLDIWELKDLGHQTVQRIVHAFDPLQSMQEINQNFPSIVSSLSRMKLDDSIKDEIIANQRMVQPGKSLMALNGAVLNIDDIDLYLLLDMVHEELSLVDQFASLKIPSSTIKKLFLSPPPSESVTFRIDFRSAHVHYLNNLEVDTMYRRWRSNINELLMPVFPGQLRYIRKNIFHAVYVIDPAIACGLKTVEMIMSLYENNVPMRFGVILFSSSLVKNIEANDGDLPKDTLAKAGLNREEDISSLIIRLFLYIQENYGANLAFSFLSEVNVMSEDSDKSLEIHHVEAAFVESLMSKVKSPPQEILLKIKKDMLFKERAEESSLFVFKLGISKLQCCLLMNGLVHEPTEESSINAMNEELPRIQEQVYYGNIDSRTDILEKLLSENGYGRYNPRIVAVGKGQKKFISLTKEALSGDSVLADISYLHPPETVDDTKQITHLISVDITSKKGMRLLHEGLNYLMRGPKSVRIGFLMNSNDSAVPPRASSLLFAKLFELATSLFSHKPRVLYFLDQLTSVYESDYMHDVSSSGEKLQSFVDYVSELAATNGLTTKRFRTVLSEFSAEGVKKSLDKVANFLYRQLGSPFGTNGVITNGRVIVCDDGDALVSDDLSLLESMESEQRVKNIAALIEEVEWRDLDPDTLTSKFFSDVIMYASSSMATRKRSSERLRFDVLNAKYSAVILNNENSTIHVDAVIDPLSSAGQKLAPLLCVLRKLVHPSMRIVLNPVDDFSSLDFSITGPKAFFSNMPLSKTLTMNLDVPEPWLIEPVIAVHDLDNILLENLGDVRTLQAGFELEALLLTGHCTEKDRDHPRGLQFILGTKALPHLVDTLVMANLGYWQLKVSPGVWYLQLAPGRSADLYIMPENEIGNQQSGKQIVLDDLRGKLVYLEVMKRKGKEHEQLLATATDEHAEKRKGDGVGGWNANILKWASDLIGGVEQARKRQVPSGDFIPHMAQGYGFDYELITYKWPSWLHKQTEKQRIIWAYKILFLDVIFPLSLEKVIFVDADQVVRADMGELYDMDIKGRPLAYTPFCDNNKDMDGYRFWRQGFWKDHLQGKPYHISALYVVDLVRFRQTAAGDNLRVFYETLSKDPNSLANLDQDLPNYAQHTVPIFSLPQEWLWCESWCGNATKFKAKTIDLCNNPMTKEPKLQGARRIVSEWPELDMEARRFSAKVFGEEFEPLSSPAEETPKADSSSVGLDGVDKESRSEL